MKRWVGAVLFIGWVVLWLVVLVCELRAAPTMVANVKSIASDGAILNAVGCNISAVSVGPMSNSTAPVLTATVDCRPDTLFGAGFE